MDVAISNDEIVFDGIESSYELHKTWSWFQALMDTTPNTTQVVLEGLFRDTTGKMVRVDREHSITLDYRTTIREIWTDGWSDGRLRLLVLHRSVPLTAYMSIRATSPISTLDSTGDSAGRGPDSLEGPVLTAAPAVRTAPPAAESIDLSTI